MVASRNSLWARRLSRTAGVRGEDHSSFGGVTTPKVGLIYSPNDDFTAKASWGRSFKAPTLLQINQGQVAQLSFPRNFGGTGYSDEDMVIRVGGGNRHLEPERARTLSRSEEHTSELQSLMRTSYAVFCLKK